MPEESESLDELIARRDDLIRLQEAMQKRLASATKEEQLELEALSKRAIKPECSFDRKAPRTLVCIGALSGSYWKLRERIHRAVHHH